jgi:hypothetical protein
MEAISMQHQQSRFERVQPGVTRRTVGQHGVAPVRWVAASTEIGASPDVVWDLCCDPHRYRMRRLAQDAMERTVANVKAAAEAPRT